jgi:hypothetical protein
MGLLLMRPGRLQSVHGSGLVPVVQPWLLLEWLWLVVVQRLRRGLLLERLGMVELQRMRNRLLSVLLWNDLLRCLPCWLLPAEHGRVLVGVLQLQPGILFVCRLHLVCRMQRRLLPAVLDQQCLLRLPGRLLSRMGCCPAVVCQLWMLAGLLLACGHGRLLLHLLRWLLFQLVLVGMPRLRCWLLLPGCCWWLHLVWCWLLPALHCILVLLHLPCRPVPALHCPVLVLLLRCWLLPDNWRCCLVHGNLPCWQVHWHMQHGVHKLPGRSVFWCRCRWVHKLPRGFIRIFCRECWMHKLRGRLLCH